MGENIMKADVVVLLRCRYRVWQLAACFQNIEQVFADTELEYLIYCLADRATPEVWCELEREQAINPRLRIVVMNDGTKGHRWARTGMHGLNVGLDHVDGDDVRPAWIYFHDDDEILPKDCGRTLERCLNEKDILAWTATSLFLWDNFRNVNINIFHHTPIFFRYRLGDRFPEDGRSVSTTDWIHKRILRNPFRKKTLPFFIKDLSALNRAERQEQVERFKRSGKDDSYTRPFSRPPCIMSVQCTKIFYEEW
jgi:hypothetical protein